MDDTIDSFLVWLKVEIARVEEKFDHYFSCFDEDNRESHMRMVNI